MSIKLKIIKLAYFDPDQLLLILNAVGWPALMAALYFWGPT